MSRTTLLTGTAGGVMGAIMALLGMTWSIITILLIGETNQNIIVASLLAYNVPLLQPLISTSMLLWFSVFSLILAIFLIVSGILTGVGFYGLHTAGGGPMGVVGLILSIVGSSAGAAFIILGSILFSPIYIPSYYSTSTSTGTSTMFSFFPVIVPAFLIVWIGVLILTGTFIVLGVASIAVRRVTNRTGLAATSGILSIVGGAFLFLYTLFAIGTSSVGYLSLIGGTAMAGIFFTLIGFVLLFIAFLMWAIVFYSSSTTIKK
jgi:hypothetical protein